MYQPSSTAIFVFLLNSFGALTCLATMQLESFFMFSAFAITHGVFMIVKSILS
jgi:hypothetical protein